MWFSGHRRTLKVNTSFTSSRILSSVIKAVSRAIGLITSIGAGEAPAERGHAAWTALMKFEEMTFRRRHNSTGQASDPVRRNTLLCATVHFIMHSFVFPPSIKMSEIIEDLTCPQAQDGVSRLLDVSSSQQCESQSQATWFQIIQNRMKHKITTFKKLKPFNIGYVLPHLRRSSKETKSTVLDCLNITPIRGTAPTGVRLPTMGEGRSSQEAKTHMHIQACYYLTACFCHTVTYFMLQLWEGIQSSFRGEELHKGSCLCELPTARWWW